MICQFFNLSGVGLRPHPLIFKGALGAFTGKSFIMKNFKLSIVLFIGTLFFCLVQYLFPSILPAIGVMIMSIATFTVFDEEWQLYLSKHRKGGRKTVDND